jgi:hypothetical protein
MLNPILWNAGWRLNRFHAPPCLVERAQKSQGGHGRQPVCRPLAARNRTRFGDNSFFCLTPQVKSLRQHTRFPSELLRALGPTHSALAIVFKTEAPCLVVVRRPAVSQIAQLAMAPRTRKVAATAALMAGGRSAAGVFGSWVPLDLA